MIDRSDNYENIHHLIVDVDDINPDFLQNTLLPHWSMSYEKKYFDLLGEKVIKVASTPTNGFHFFRKVAERVHFGFRTRPCWFPDRDGFYARLEVKYGVEYTTGQVDFSRRFSAVTKRGFEALTKYVQDEEFCCSILAEFLH